MVGVRDSGAASSAEVLRIAHLFPGAMGLYGDQGNVLALRRRCEWRSIPVEVVEVQSGDDFAPADWDVVFLGGGADRDQEAVAAELAGMRAGALAEAVDDGLAMLAVCGGYQFLGQSYRTADGSLLDGLGVLPVRTENGPGRLVGPIEVEAASEYGGILVGFENHGGRTTILEGGEPLGVVLRGYGNNGEDRTEGCRLKNCFGTYLHGPVLPQNPGLADALIRAALERREGSATVELAPLDDRLELDARTVAANQDSRKKSLLGRLGLDF
ncbi:MAG: glutamine amidotransferase [Acidobacteria bacterium]|nr:MAG: glutamine amidotransferase [Acidobacteriota bacterium]